jgi:hypothetical protein
MLECIAVERDGWRELCDPVRGFARDHAEPSLSDCERNFRLHVALQEIVVGEYRAHFGRAEHVLEDVAVEDGGRHQDFPAKARCSCA